MLVYVNASDYMPTTEATGVRLTIHDKDEFPFPDTFGYSAPTGYVSSFGLRLVSLYYWPFILHGIRLIRPEGCRLSRESTFLGPSESANWQQGCLGETYM